MIQCKSLEEACAVENLMHIESGADRIIAYQHGDELPDYCLPPPPDNAPSDVEILKAQVAALEQALVSANIAVPAAVMGD